jgi:hypothetical protein
MRRLVFKRSLLFPFSPSSQTITPFQNPLFLHYQPLKISQNFFTNPQTNFTNQLSSLFSSHPYHSLSPKPPPSPITSINQNLNLKPKPLNTGSTLHGTSPNLEGSIYSTLSTQFWRRFRVPTPNAPGPVKQSDPLRTPTLTSPPLQFNSLELTFQAPV